MDEEPKPRLLSQYIYYIILDWNSALMIAINGPNQEHTEMLQTGVLRQILEEKWKHYVRVT